MGMSWFWGRFSTLSKSPPPSSSHAHELVLGQVQHPAQDTPPSSHAHELVLGQVQNPAQETPSLLLTCA